MGLVLDGLRQVYALIISLFSRSAMVRAILRMLRKAQEQAIIVPADIAIFGTIARMSLLNLGQHTLFPFVSVALILYYLSLFLPVGVLKKAIAY
jgi:hypothetical protein